MNLLPMERLGPHETDGGFDFGLFLPWVSARDSNRVSLKIIHEHDQFLQAIQPLEVPLTCADDPEYGDYWSGRSSSTRLSMSSPPPLGAVPGATSTATSSTRRTEPRRSTG